MQKKWLIKEIVDLQADDLIVNAGISAITARILNSRGMHTVDDVSRFLTPALSAMPDPLLLKGMQAALDRLLLARKNNETVCIYGDYDVDGISGTALLVSFLRNVGYSCRYFIPNRFEDGVCLKDMVDVVKLTKLALLQVFEATVQKLNCIFILSLKHAFKYDRFCIEI